MHSPPPTEPTAPTDQPDIAERLRMVREQAETFNQIARDLSGELDTQALVQKVTDAGVRLTGAKFGAYFYNRIDDDGATYQLYTLSGAPREAFERFGMPRATPLFGPTFHGEGPVRIDDVLADPRYGLNAPHRGMPPGHLPVRSYLALPVRSRTGEVLGGLFFGHPEVGVFTEDAERLALGLAAQAAVAIDNANLYGQALGEIERRKAVEAELRDSRRAADAERRRYADLIGLLPAAVYATDGDGMLTMYNPAAAELWGRAPQLGVTRWCGSCRVFTPAGEPIAMERCPMALAVTEGRVFRDHEVVIERPDGSTRHLLVNLTPTRDPDGRIVGAINVLIDITDRKLAERALRDSEQRLHALADNIAQLAWMCEGRLGDVTWYNRRWYQYTGTAFEQMRGEGWKQCHHPDHIDRVMAGVRRAAASGTPWEDTFPLRGRDGQYRWFLSRAVPIHDDAGRIVRWFGTNTDVTEQRRAADALRESESRFRSIADAAPAKLWVTDPTGSCTFLSRRWYQVTGQTATTALGWGWLHAVHDEDREAARSAVLGATEAREPFGMEFRFRRVGGEYRWGLVSGQPRVDDSGQFLGLVGSVIDITDRKEAERVLRAANEDLERRVAERTHQLRALARVLTQTEQRERKRLARIMHDEIQQILAVAKIHASLATDRPADPGPIRQVARLIDQAIAACRDLTVNLSPPIVRDASLGAALQWLARRMAEQHSLRIDVREIGPAPQVPEDLRILLFDVTRELLFNVAKHSGADAACVTLGRDDGGVYVAVADKGRGCEPASLERPDGNSFGLFSIRERLADLGGRFEADGAPGRGCRVRVWVPHGPDEQAGHVADTICDVRTDIDPEPPTGVLRVLLADDHAMLRQGLAELLAAQPGTRVVGQASDGVEAVALARRLKPDVVVMDINMPRLGGIEATRQIRSQMPGVRVVALSMHEQGDLEAAMLDAGAEAFVNKCDPGSSLLAALRGRSVRENTPDPV